MPETTQTILHRLYDGLRSVVTFDAYAAAVRAASEDEPAVKLTKDDPAVGYGPAAEDGPSCFGCRHYQWGACSLVEGIIEATGGCSLHRAPVEVVPPELLAEPDADLAMTEPQLFHVARGDGGAWRLFLEQTVADAPARVPLLPRPGTYTHPKYGTIALDPQRIDRFVANVNKGLYQQQVPVDAEHQTKLSGALGWIQRAEVNADGSADAVVTWTQRGRDLLADNRFRYVSPEWYETWRDPATGQEHADVLVGLALTTRPFFKDGSLRPLVASEGELRADGDAAAAEGREMAESQTMAEETAQRFAELERQMSELAAAKQAAEDKLTALEAERVRQGFSDEIAGRVDGGVRWFGEEALHLAVLEALPGELRDRYIAYGRQVANVLAAAQAPLLAETGSDVQPQAAGEQSAWAQIEAKARVLAGEKGITIEQARTTVLLSDRELGRAYAAERTVAAVEG